MHVKNRLQLMFCLFDWKLGWLGHCIPECSYHTRLSEVANSERRNIYPYLINIEYIMATKKTLVALKELWLLGLFFLPSNCVGHKSHNDSKIYFRNHLIQDQLSSLACTIFRFLFHILRSKLIFFSTYQTLRPRPQWLEYPARLREN